MALMPIHTANLQAINAIGRSDIFLKLEIIKKVTGVIVLIAVMHLGVMAIALSGVFLTLLSSVINAYPNSKLLDYKITDQIKDLLNAFIPLLLMVASVCFIDVIELNLVLDLVAKVIVGAVVYVLSSYLFKNESFMYIWKVIKKQIIR